ncbi:MAG: Phenylacetic acid catabolic protein [Woeseiaceae bacterium]|nr:Phenylacetic acid catabolic protein [Woeseiaceae bacterium]
MMFGPGDSDSTHSAQSMAWKIKRFSNDELRQKFVDATVPQAEYLGLKIPDDDLHYDADSGHYRFGAIDWQEFYEVLERQRPVQSPAARNPAAGAGRRRLGARGRDAPTPRSTPPRRAPRNRRVSVMTRRATQPAAGTRCSSAPVPG